MEAHVLRGVPDDLSTLRAAWSDVVARAGGPGSVAAVSTSGGWLGVLRPGPGVAVDVGPLEKALAGPLGSFASDDVEVVMAGLPAQGCDFVQVMEATVSDRQAWAEVDREGIPRFAATRPDFLGSIRLWRPGGRLTVVDSFTSEPEARAGEAVPPPAEDEAVYAAWFGFLSDVVWHDLIDPWRG